MKENVLAHLIDIFQRMINRQDWMSLNKLLTQTITNKDLEDISIIALLRTTFAVRRELEQWQPALEAAQLRMPEEILRGLDERTS